MGTRRAQWAKRVRQWRQSGLMAREFAERAGINAGTLRLDANIFRRVTLATDPRRAAA